LTWSSEHEKEEFRTYAMNNSSHRKKHYQPPSCIELSIAEFAGLVRRKTSGRESRPGSRSPSALAEVSLLLVEDYVGDLSFIQPAGRASAREEEPFSTERGLGWFEMQFVDAERAKAPDTFLLLDLRYCHHEERGFFESIGHPLDLNEVVPRVILANSSEPFLGWTGVDRTQCWQLRSCLSPEDLSAALHSLIQLCARFADSTAEYGSSLESAPGHALSGKKTKH